MTRKTAAHLFTSVNGVVDNPDRFQFDAFGPEEGELMGKAIAPVTDVVIGRKLWEEWKDFWTSTGASDPFGDFINPVRKHVVSSTLSGELDWNSTAIDGDPADYVAELRTTEGGDISVVGGVETTRSLFSAGAIDTLTLTMHPVVTNDGRRLFDETIPLTRLQLVDSTVTKAGNAVLTYGLRTD